MQEHAGEKRQKRLQRRVAVAFKRQFECARSERPGLHEGLGRRRRKRDLMDEDDNVGQDQ